MPPKQDKKDAKEADLTAVVVVDSFDRRFSPLTDGNGPWCVQKLCNVPLIHYTLAWIARTECKNIILVVTKENYAALEDVYHEWQHCFTEFSIVPCNAMSVGDAIRELWSRGKIQGDFLLVSNPATITSATLKNEIARFRELRKADKAGNVMTLIYNTLENQNNEVIAVDSNNKLRLYHREDDITRLDIDKKSFTEELVIRRDISDTGIALCALSIAAQFSDNFDFQHTDNIIREILVNEEILLQNIHVAVLASNEAALSINDYETLLLGQTLMMEHWFYPLVPNRMPCIDRHISVELDKNIFIFTLFNPKNFCKAPNFPIFSGYNVCIGQDYDVEENVVMNNVAIGNYNKIGYGSELTNCLFGDRCKIGKNCRLANVVLGSDVIIPDDTILSEQSIIGTGVSYPPGMIFPANSALCKIQPDEDDDSIQAETLEGLYAWRLTTSKSYWKYAGRRAALSDVDFEYEEGAIPSVSDSESDESQGVEVDPLSVFLEEVTESMERIRTFDFTRELMNNLILEINSSRLANNISVDDLTKNVFFAFLALEGNDNLKEFLKLTKQWKPMFDNYYKTKRSQIQLLMGLEEIHHKRGDLFPPARCTKICQLIYDEDIVEEDAIVEWFTTMPESSTLKLSLGLLVNWLQQSEEEDSD